MKTRILFILLICISINTFSQISDNLLKVQGNAIIYETPELMVADITISAKDSIYSLCSDKLIEYYNLIEKSFVKNGISKNKLKSGGLNINESYSWSDRERKMDGYMGTIKIILELPYNATSLNTIIKTLKGNEFPVTYNLSFKLSNNQKEVLLEKAIELAIKDAKKKANYIAESMDLKILKVKDINYGYTSYQNDLLTNASEVFFVIEDEAELDQDINLNPQKLEIKKTIGIIWNIEQ